MIYIVFICDIYGQTTVEKVFSSVQKATRYVEGIILVSNVRFELKYNSNALKRWCSNGARIEIRQYVSNVEDYVYVLTFCNNRGTLYVESIFKDMLSATRHVRGSFRYSRKRFVLKYNRETRKSWRSVNVKIDITRFQIE